MRRRLEGGWPWLFTKRICLGTGMLSACLLAFARVLFSFAGSVGIIAPITWREGNTSARNANELQSRLSRQRCRLRISDGGCSVWLQKLPFVRARSFKASTMKIVDGSFNLANRPTWSLASARCKMRRLQRVDLLRRVDAGIQ